MAKRFPYYNDITVIFTWYGQENHLYNQMEFYNRMVQKYNYIPRVIVINDGSKEDESISFLKILSEHGSCIKYIKNQSSLGLAKCRNIAIRKCTNNIFTFLDDDDF